MIVHMGLLAAGLFLLARLHALYGQAGMCVGCGGRGAHKTNCPLDR